MGRRLDARDLGAMHGVIRGVENYINAESVGSRSIGVSEERGLLLSRLTKPPRYTAGIRPPEVQTTDRENEDGHI